MFEKSISDMDSAKYLGDTRVVTELAGKFIYDISTAGGMGKINAIMAAVNKMSDIFMGFDEAYLTIPDWNDGEHLGRVLARRLSVSHEQASTEVFKTAFMVFTTYILQLIKDSPGKDDAVVQGEVESLKKYMVSVLIGTADTLYPNDKSWK